MSSKRYTELPEAAALDGSEVLAVVQSGSSRKTTVAAVGSGGGRAYHYGSFAVSAIAAGEILMDHIVATAHTLADDFAGCVASVGGNPAAAWVGNVSINGVAVGTLSISTGGVCTFATTGAAIAVAAGDVVTLTAPAGVDAAIARLRFTFKGAI